MIINFVVVEPSGDSYSLTEKAFSVNSVKETSPDNDMKQNLNEGLLPEGINPGVSFTKIITETGTYTVVGSHSEVVSKLNNDKKILHG